MSKLLHIARRENWAAAVRKGDYRPESLVDEGFIHCSLPEQVVSVADAMYRGQPDLVLLVIDPDRVPAEIRFEDCYQSGQEFPHIYGPLPVAAVDQVVAFESDPEGRFSLPVDFDRSDGSGRGQ